MDPATAGLIIGAIGVTVALWNRWTARENLTNSELKGYCQDLEDDCEKWANLLRHLFEDLAGLWTSLDAKEAGAETTQWLSKMTTKLEVAMKEESHTIPYEDLLYSNPAMRILNERSTEHRACADACNIFYYEALHLKQTVYWSIQLNPHTGADIGKLVEKCNDEVDARLQDVRRTNRVVQAIKIK